MAEEAAAAGLTGALRTLLAALPARRRRQLWLLNLLTLANAAADMAMVAAAMLFLAAVAGQALPAALAGWLPDVGPDQRIAQAALAFALAALGANLVRLLHLRLSEAYAAAVAHELTVEVQRRVLAQPYAFHARHRSSELLASLETAGALAFNLIRPLLQTFAAVATSAAILALLASLAPLPALAAVVILAVLYLAVARLAARRLAANSDEAAQAFGERIRKVQEGLGAIRDLKIDHLERAQLEDFRLADARYMRASASTAFIAAAPRYVIEVGAVLLVAAIALVMARRGDSDSLVLLGGIAVGGLRLLPLLQSAYRSWAYMTASRAIIGQVTAMLRLPVHDEEDQAEPLPFRQAMRLDRVSFSYEGRRQPALRDISLDIRSGERIAIAGATGSGKSTLADVLMGLLLPDEGTIAVDGHRLSAGNVRAWQRNIAHVSQSVFLLDDSIARNIAFSQAGEPVDLARVRRAAEAAGIADFIDSLPDGFATSAGERGIRLSGGQRQRIAIARALYKRASVLVLDEATNALDEDTEARVLANIFADPDLTILVIAHRPSALANCDRTIHLGEGRIITG